MFGREDGQSAILAGEQGILEYGTGRHESQRVAKWGERSALASFATFALKYRLFSGRKGDFWAKIRAVGSDFVVAGPAGAGQKGQNSPGPTGAGYNPSEKFENRSKDRFWGPKIAKIRAGGGYWNCTW